MEKTKTDLILEKLDEISQKLDLALKALNLAPVSEEEEKKIRLLRKSNEYVQEKVYNEVEVTDTKKVAETFNIANNDIYADVLGPEFL